MGSSFQTQLRVRVMSFVYMSFMHILSCVFTGTNKALDFLEQIIVWLDSGVLSNGDVLILDNASLHKSEEINGLLSLLLDAAGVRMYFLPRYSPEVSVSLARCICSSDVRAVQPLRTNIRSRKALFARTARQRKLPFGDSGGVWHSTMGQCRRVL